jgi:hypothetical protein
MPRKTSFCNAALLRSDIKRYWPLLFLYVAVWVVILPMQILSASRECDGVAEGIMTVLQLRQHNVIIQSIPASVVMSLLFGCFAAMAVWSYLMSGRTVGLMHALPVTRTQAFFSHILSVLGALTAGNVQIFLLTALCSAGFSYVDWTALGTWLLLTELMALLNRFRERTRSKFWPSVLGCQKPVSRPSRPVMRWMWPRPATRPIWLCCAAS